MCGFLCQIFRKDVILKSFLKIFVPVSLSYKLSFFFPQAWEGWERVKKVVHAWSPFAVQFKKKQYPWVQLAGHGGTQNIIYTSTQDAGSVGQPGI